MATYNVGEKVRIISKRGSCWNPKGLMDKYCGTVMTIRDNHKWGSDGLYAMEEDRHENGGSGWCWNDSDIVGRVTDEKIVITHDGKVTTATLYGVMGNKVTATARCAPEDTFDFNVGAKLAMERLMEKVAPAVEPTEPDSEWRVVNRKAKVGDFIRLKTNGMYPWNEPGDILKVDEVGHGTIVRVRGENHIRKTDDPEFMWNYILPEYEVVEKVKEDNPITVGGFKIGDRVNYNGVNGTVICFVKDDYDVIGVEFDMPTDIAHNCDGLPLMAGDIGTKCTSRWMAVTEVTAGEVPQYYNGKVICVERGYGVSIPVDCFTVGKIYEVINGKVTSDDGWTCNGNYKNIRKLSQGLGYKFIELVE